MRLWSKCRRAICDSWEAAHDRKYFAAGVGRSPLSPVWRAAVTAEQGSAGEESAASVMADIGTFFDKMPHEQLRAAARRWGFPAVLLEVALRFYSSARHIVVGKSAAAALYATRGVVAGCSLCTTLAKLILLTPMDALCSACPSVDVDVFVDDVRLGAIGSPDVVVRTLVEAFEEVEGLLDAVGVPLKMDKTGVATSSAGLAGRLARCLGISGAGGATGCGEFLGADFAPGRARRHWARTSKRRSRFRAAFARLKRVGTLRRAAGPRARLITTAGLLPQAAFAAEITGLTSQEWVRLRHAAAVGLGGRCGGRSTLRLLLLDGDPTIAAAIAPATRWAQEVWAAAMGDQAVLSLGQLAVAHAELLKRQPRCWSQVRGPAGALWLTLRRMGWTWPEPWVFQDCNGVDINLGRLSPVMVKKHLTSAVVADMEKAASRRLSQKEVADRPMDPPIGDGSQVPAPSAAHLSFAPARRVLRGTQLSALEKGSLKSAISGALWTRDRLALAGYAAAPTCPLCSTGAADTLFHRLWKCPETADLRQGCPAIVRRALAEGPTSPLYTLALPPHPAADDGYFAPCDDPCIEYHGFSAGEDLRFRPGPVFLDGSCFPSVVPECSRAAWAVVQTDEEGQVRRSISGVVPGHLPQTAQAGEYCALEAAAQAASAENTLYGDCQGVVADAQRGWCPRGWAKRMYGGCMRAAFTSTQAHSALCTMAKVKAHQQLDTLQGRDLELARGNAAADELAKAASSRHPQPCSAHKASTAAQLADAEQVALLIGRASARWPRARDPGAGRALLREQLTAVQRRERASRRRADREERKHARAAQQRVTDATHEWVRWRGATRCKRCLCQRSSTTSACPGVAAAFCRVLTGASARGHRIWAAEAVPPGGCSAPLPFLACIQCGAWRTVGNSARLDGQCAAPSKHGMSAIRRMRRGVFPRADRRWTGYSLADLMPVPGVDDD